MISRLHGLSIQAQVFLLLLAVPLVVSLLGMSLAPVAVEVAMVGESDATIRAVAHAVRVAVGFVACSGFVAAIGAAAVLRGSIGSLVGCMQVATDALARGHFRHRIGSHRTDELGRLAHAIDLMAEQLERLEAARRRMLAGVSHELRTPLTIIRGHAYTLARHEASAPHRSRLELIDAEVLRLNALVEDLVDASSLQAGGVALDRQAFSLVDLVTAAVRRFDVEAAQRGIELAVLAGAPRPEAWLDATRFHQVLANLLANAVRHADAATTVSVEVRHDGSADEHVVVVRNVGPEIPPSRAERIFEPFEQGDEQVGRVGLGLAIARSIAEAHGGSLRLSPARVAREVAFDIRIPSGPPAPSPAVAQRPDVSRLTVLTPRGGNA
ncbi:MAG: histidine kinase with domain [Thermoleophilia bacterium]|nr:histidine kinase with domain [Thermoleophilia bacterium]